MKIVITDPLPQGGLSLFKSINTHQLVQLDLSKAEDPRSVLLNAIVDADALVSLLNRKIDKTIINSASKLKIIANYAVGYDNIDIQAAHKRNIWVTNTPDVLTDATADLTWSLILAITRRVIEGDALCRAGGFTGWGANLLLGSELRGKTLGIIGFGAIGKAVAKRAFGFGMNVIYARRKTMSEETSLGGHCALARSLSETIKEADILSLHTPLTDDSYHLIGANELRHMKKSAYLINTARGPVVDESALAQALKKGDIRGAALDVYEFEPAINEALKTLDNVVLLPHLGSATEETRKDMVRIVAENISAAFAGKTPPQAIKNRHERRDFQTFAYEL